jgi:hypothetical protein
MPSEIPPVKPIRKLLTVRGVILQLAIVWVLYTLSIGPMFWTWFGARFVDGPYWVLAFYSPLQYVCECVPVYGDLVENYIWWWNFQSPQELSDSAQQLVAG